MALQVLLIAGLLADEGDGSADWTFAEDSARAAFDHRIGGGDKSLSGKPAAGVC